MMQCRSEYRQAPFLARYLQYAASASLPTRTRSRQLQNRPSGDMVTSEILKPGETAPDFTLKSTPDQAVKLSDLRGRPVVLVFYPADWSPVCGDELALYNELREEFQEFDATILGISVDGTWCHRAFAEARHLHFPLLADFHPKGAVAKSYHVYRDDDGTSERALFVIDAQGVIQWSYLSPIGVNPGAAGILSALERLTPEQLGGMRRERQPNARPSDTRERGEESRP